MANPIGTYSFLSLPARRAREQDHAARPGPGEAARQLRRAAESEGAAVGGGAPLTASIDKPVQLYGPGDIVGIEPRAIFKTEPLHWITNFESNYLPYVDFYEEDFPWRYTPARPDEALHRLRPWIALVVLEEGEFEDGTNLQGQAAALHPGGCARQRSSRRRTSSGPGRTSTSTRISRRAPPRCSRRTWTRCCRSSTAR